MRNIQRHFFIIICFNFYFNLCYSQVTNGSVQNGCPTCDIYCSPSVLGSVTIQATCEFNGTTVSCQDPILPGTQATIACAVGYEKSTFDTNDNLHCGNDGEWNSSPYRCEQVCGDEHPDFTASILGGTKTNNTKVPWNVAIYSSLNRPNEQICGGTILSAKIVISAAHCFWNHTTAQKNDVSYYKIGAGKYYRDYNAKEPLPVQLVNVQEIHINENYKGLELGDLNNIAVVVLENYLRFTFYIKPGCLIWKSYSEQRMKSNLIGRVAGWGLTAEGIPSVALKTVELSSVSYEDCLSKIPDPKLLQFDKFCANNKADVSVCQGDSGAGFLVPVEVNGKKKYVLQGIVSNGLTNSDMCTSENFITAYTTIQYFKDMVTAFMDAFQVK